jgi:hypothetical protein
MVEGMETDSTYYQPLHILHDRIQPTLSSSNSTLYRAGEGGPGDGGGEGEGLWLQSVSPRSQ